MSTTSVDAEIPTTDARPCDRRTTGVLSAVLVALVAAAYLQTAGHDFVSYDDQVYVYENEYVTTGLSWDNFIWAFEIHGPSMWVPLTWLTHQTAWELFEDDPTGHHLVNVALHAANAVLLFLVLRSLTQATWPAALVAALFAIHPLHVESVAWVTERKDVLCGFFWLTAIAAYTRYARRGGAGWYAVVCLSHLLAVMAKPLAVTLPCVLLLLDYWPLGRVGLGQALPGGHTAAARPALWRRVALLVGEKLPLLAISALSSYLTLMCQLRIGAVASTDDFPLGARAANGVLAYAAYLRKLVWPVDLACFYPYVRDFHAGQVVGATLLLAAITLAALWYVRKAPALLVGWLWYLGVMVPMSGILQAGSHSMADRFTYLPMIGIYIAIVFGLGQLARAYFSDTFFDFAGSDASSPRPRATWPYVPILLGGLVVLVLFPITWRQVGVWRDSFSLFDHAVRVTDRNFLALTNRGIAYQARGENEAALADYAAAIEIKPDYAKAYVNRGKLLHDGGRHEAALADFDRALEHNPGNVSAHYNRGLARLALRQVDEAIDDCNKVLEWIAQGHPNAEDAGDDFAAGCLVCRGHALSIKQDYAAASADYVRALEVHPQELSAYYGLARLALRDQDPERALELYDQAIATDSNDPRAFFNRGNTYRKLKDYERALADYDRAIELDPAHRLALNNRGRLHQLMGNYSAARGDFQQAVAEHPQSAASHRALAWLLATCPDAEIRDAEQALVHALRSRELSSPADPHALRTLAAAQAEAGDFASAAISQQRAIAVASEGLRRQLLKVLALYQQGKPYRDRESLPAP
ncbi:MAG: tetratricopeptide repeat protein [Planctomycetota bacterium]|nr:MAG: tetratricopeptide repeat protein [Planctomycetota bacterium]